MSKTKKIIIFAILGCVLLTIGSVTGLYYYKLNKVVTVLTLDINPCLKLSLNYKNEVIKAEGLNSDGKKILKSENFKNNDLEDIIEELVELVIAKGYIKNEETFVLVNIEGKDIKEKIVTLINKEFKEENVECNVIFQEINAEAKSNAEKYGISESKASYIEQIIKNNKNITFDELKDKSINEINEMVKNTENKEEEKEDNQTQQETNTNPSSSETENSNTTTKIPTKKPVSTPPESNDRTGAWCEFYKTIPPEGGVEYSTPGYINDTQKYVEAAKNIMPADSDWSQFFSSITQYRTASYCSAGIVELENYDKTKTYTAYLDSVTLELLDLNTKEIVKPSIDEAGAKIIVTKWLLDNYGIDINNCGWESYYYAIDGSTKIPEWQYICKIEETTTYYTVTVVATDGRLKDSRTWTN